MPNAPTKIKRYSFFSLIASTQLSSSAPTR
jgi:hypothetical protein